MDNGQAKQHIETIRQQMTALAKLLSALNQGKIAAALDGLQLVDEETQTCLKVAEIIERELLAEKQQLEARCQHYYELFQSLPVAYLVINSSGLILEANRAIATLLNAPQHHLIRKPMVVFLAEEDRRTFGKMLAKLPQASEMGTWEMKLAPLQGEPIAVEMQMAIARDGSGEVASLQIAVFDRSQTQPQVTPSVLPQVPEAERLTAVPPTLPPSLDGLQVLFVDDEADAREFVTAVLEAQGIRVTAVDSAAAALAAIEQHRPDVLVSDIRMADQDGYALIRRVRELEAQQGWHVPAAALTAYLDESREKALTAGFEAHLHKLAQPSELVKLVSQLSGRSDS
ncbi:MAG: response regulator [Synechococcales bacterium]|nr:response regulator [Synechococcales bacterium]